jgi:hypothetical protein
VVAPLSGEGLRAQSSVLIPRSGSIELGPIRAGGLPRRGRNLRDSPPYATTWTVPSISFVADAAINIAMKHIAAGFVRYKPEAGRWAGKEIAARKSGR